ncbi:MAG: DeoR/GlpR transcriptional regulator [Anaerolineales bacterium]|nr:DeoR/GlpR transcriptional regulator [Chloroflexota bacterium]MBL6982382.1 DeoR/GlpR transcriptional regulator [Anaerolineales bacterium]
MKILETQGSVLVTDLVSKFDVSEMTVRRDLDLLERKGLLRRVHGGAISDLGRSYEPPFLTRSTTNQAEKERIGMLAAELIHSGDSITLDVGTSTLEVARKITDKQNLTILTPCFQIAGLLCEKPGIRLILTGGILRPGELSMVGHLAERVFEEFHVDKLFIAAAGVDFETGLTEYNVEDTQVKKAMLQSAKQVILVADASKFNRVAFTTIAPLDVVNTVITDKSIDPSIVTRLNDLSINVMLA